ncbi:glycosyltransferase family 4 protein [Clostridium celatum]|uniref:glycosyltransferase family 4 protein n=1 Tax=Clostridium celatum TaxID=36834 RepID=UPI0029041A3A|nr:glycosyltransferase family 4 protein [Clostridium celatum]MDU2266594.1 glycosyltransferase family 4 protein [Clostridium celatum]MDU3723816.1 glycosyltransferase family 4 protein [Clostridium celatum]MDU6294622.1 glycosyltransferase family 4 protein [Clostridium celatum]
MEKLLLLNDSGNFGGVQSVFRNILNYGAFNGFNIDILFATNGPIYDEIQGKGYNINYIVDFKKFKSLEIIVLLFKIIKTTDRMLKNKKYDKVYANGFLSCVACGILSKKYKNIKFVWHEHNRPPSEIRKKFLKGILKNIKKVIVVSNGIRDNYCIKDNEKVVVVYNGIESDDISYLENKSPNKIKLAVVSRMDRGKGHLETIEAFNNASRDDMELYIIGGATNKEALIVEEEIKRKCEENKNIKLIGFTKEVDKYYKEMDIIIQASTKWDSLPTVLIEAMNYNCALIGSDVGGIPEIINNDNGYIVKKDRLVEDLTALLKGLKKDDEIISKQVKAKSILKEKFIISRQVKIINDILKSI